ncbi:protein Mis18-alpha-like isoform X2 [Pseudophryne corroboree]|uniref:protein Mis18-alpha-like isoform X2 n=1 Tax=Pseudophryne corroboree TaxID=495146 RepID=UPI003081B2E5
MEDVTDDSQGNMSTYIRQCSKAAIYLCGKCWRPLGDTQDFVENNVGDCLILLKAVTDQVEIDPRMQVFTLPNEVGSTIQILRCKCCSSTIGRFYSKTEKHLDYKCGLFGLDWSAIKRYILGSADNQLMPEGEAPITLYKYDLLEKEMKKVRCIHSTGNPGRTQEKSWFRGGSWTWYILPAVGMRAVT